VPRLPSSVCRLALCGLGVCGLLSAQDGAGQAEVGFQQYYLSVGAQAVVNISGLTLNSAELIPNVGLLSASFAPAVSSGQFRTGEDFLRLKGLPWKGEYWTFGVGDFHLPGQLLAVPFSNVFVTEINARGLWAEATHGKRTFGFFYGDGTISNTPKVVLRLSVPQTLLGFYLRQQLGDRLVLGVRLMQFSNDLVALQKLSNILPQTNLKSATTLTLDSMYTLAGPLKLYSEAVWSVAREEVPQPGARDVPVSVVEGPILDTNLVTLRANYVFQSAAYFPLLGTYFGDRAGPFAEVTIRPARGLQIYGSVSQYRNNVADDPTLATFRSSSESAGGSIRLPAELSLNAQVAIIGLSTQMNDASAWTRSRNQQESANLTRRFGRHNIRLTALEFRQISTLSTQNQISGEINDSFHIRRLTVGGGVRIQRLETLQSRTTLFYRGSAQFSTRRFSAYANFEIGNDQQNKTLFATNSVSTTVVGASMTLGKNWEIHGEAYRNNLVAELNPQSIFVLEGQGVFIPGTLAGLNQWSMYLRVSRKFQWGKASELGDLNRYSNGQAALKGSVEGFVMERRSGGDIPAEGVPVILDRGIPVATDAEGRFRFVGVAEGAHKVELALRELPTDFDPGAVTESSVLVSSGKLSRADFDVIRLTSIQGTLSGPKDVPLDNIVIRILPGERYTTPDLEGNFFFYDLREGEYVIAVDQTTLPEFAVLSQPDGIAARMRAGETSEPLAFSFQVVPPAKPVRRVLGDGTPAKGIPPISPP